MAMLMISSQLLLTGFVVYWLVGQYREERLELHGQLKKEYFQVHEELMDSLLLKHLVIPSLDDTVRLEMRQHLKELPEKFKLSTIHLDESSPPDSGQRSIKFTSVITNEERMVRSIKLFINENPEAFMSDTGIFVYAMNLDSSNLLINMEHAFEERDWTFTLDWPAEDADPAVLAKTHGILIHGGSDNYLPPLQVAHFNAYLIRSILPQMLFALILLLLSGSALLFAYRSLRRQLILNRLRDDFIGNISHELKTPVSTVKIALEALSSQEKQLDSGLRGEYLEMAASELKRLESLVGKVLHHQMLNNPSLVLEKEECDLGDLARSVVRTLEIPIRDRGALVTISEEDGPCRLKVDRVYVEGMIMNLIDNSLKYTNSDPEIHLKIECRSQGTKLSVSDNGPGIPEEYKDQVFEKFFRIPSGNRHNVKGYGLGLNFAYQVMAQHNGNVSFKNLPDGGCRFTLSFPETEA